MDDIFTGVLASALSGFAFFAGIALLVWVDGLAKRRQRELTHGERLKALECGQPLPDADVARAAAEAHRAWAAGLVGILVPLALTGAAVGATALVFDRAGTPVHLPLGCVIWGVSGVVSLVAVTCSLGALARRTQPRPTGRAEGSHEADVQPATVVPADV